MEPFIPQIIFLDLVLTLQQYLFTRTSHYDKMPVKTRQKYKKLHPSQLQLNLQLRELPQRNRRFPPKKYQLKMADLYYSDQESSQVKKSEEEQESLEALQIKAEESNQDSDSKNYANAMGEQTVLKNNSKSKKQEVNQLSIALNTRSKRVANEIGNQIGKIGVPSTQLNIEKQKQSKSKSSKMLVLPNPVELMIPEEPLQPGQNQAKLQNDIQQNIQRKTVQEQSKFHKIREYLLQKCKHLDQKQLLSYKQTEEYNRLLNELIQLLPFSLEFSRPKKKLDLQIVNAVSQTFSFTTSKDSYNYELRSARKKLEQRASIKNGIDQKNQTKNSDSKSAESSSLFSQGRQQRSNQNRIIYEDQDQKYQREKIKQFISFANQHSSLNQNNIGVDKHSHDNTPSHSHLTPTNSNNRQTISNNSQTAKAQLAANQQESASKSSRGNNQAQTLAVLESKVKVEAAEQIITPQKQSVVKTQQAQPEPIAAVQQKQVKSAPNYPFNFDFNYEPKYRIWDTSKKGSKKRLQILNRFQYNPFQLENGEDQCQLWKRLMADQFDDLRGKYKYEGPKDFILQQLRKQYTLPVKVKEEDFFVPSSYDPQTKAIKQEEIETHNQNEAILKEEPVDQNLCVLEQNCQKQSQIQKQKCGQREEKGQYIALRPYDPKLDNNAISFNYDLLQDLQVSLLESKRDKVNELDFL